MPPLELPRLDIPFIQDLGVEILSAADGRAVVVLDLKPRHLNSWQMAHGGVLMALLDVSMALAGRTLFAGAGGGITIDMSTSFLQPATAGGRLSVTGMVLHHTGSMAFCEGEARDADRRLIARAMGTFKYRSPRASASGAEPEVRI